MPVAPYDLYGQNLGPVYDRLFSELEPGLVDFLARLADGRRALELGIGTGRVALPLAAQGVPLHGVDASSTMLELLAAKPGADNIAVQRQNFGELSLEGTFGLIYVVYSTLYALLSQGEQCECFRRVAEHLEPGGHFCVEGFRPDPTLFSQGQRVSVRALTDGGVVLDAAVHRPLEQRVSSRLTLVDSQGIQVYPVELRYLWPSEQDLMARLAGLRLRQRWQDWRGTAAGPQSSRLISVYHLPEGSRR